MRLLKVPKFKQCVCIKCGTVFVPEVGDEFDVTFRNTFDIARVTTPCPFCDSACEVLRDGRMDNEKKSD